MALTAWLVAATAELADLTVLHLDQDVDPWLRSPVDRANDLGS